MILRQGYVPQNGDVLQCCHCGVQWKIQTGSKRRRGICGWCRGVTCGASYCDQCSMYGKRKNPAPSISWEKMARQAYARFSVTNGCTAGTEEQEALLRLQFSLLPVMWRQAWIAACKIVAETLQAACGDEEFRTIDSIPELEQDAPSIVQTAVGGPNTMYAIKEDRRGIHIPPALALGGVKDSSEEPVFGEMESSNREKE